VIKPEDSFGNYAKRSSAKWRKYSEAVLPMHVAEMDYVVAKPISDLIISLATSSDLGYLGPLPELAPAFEKYALDKWGWQIDPHGISMATDVGVAAVEIMRAVSSPGDRVLVNSPVYPNFYSWIKEAQCEVVDVPLHPVSGSWQLDLAGIEKAFESGVKIFLICSPQNPVGRVHSAQELTQIADLAKAHGVLVISDEIHAPLAWVPFTPYLSVSDAARETGVVITSTSKSWNTAGLKAAFIATQSEVIRRRLSGMPDAMLWRSSLIGGLAMVVSYNDCAEWIEETVSMLQENLDHLCHELARMLPRAKISDMDATYLAWIDLADYHVENPMQFLLAEAKVAVMSGEEFAPQNQYSSFIRFNFATSKPRITEAVRRMAAALEGAH
jgi:cystathionine beta-lyase